MFAVARDALVMTVVIWVRQAIRANTRWGEMVADLVGRPSDALDGELSGLVQGAAVAAGPYSIGNP